MPLKHVYIAHMYNVHRISMTMTKQELAIYEFDNMMMCGVVILPPPVAFMPTEMKLQ